jgi:DNA-binding XRE family transcriptional regulator
LRRRVRPPGCDWDANGQPEAPRSSDGPHDLFALLGGFLQLAPFVVALPQLMPARHRRRAAFAPVAAPDNFASGSVAGLSGNARSGCTSIPSMNFQMTVHDEDGIGLLQRRRLALGLSRERLGAAAGGISSATVRRVERGLVSPHPATVAALARALNCEVADVFPTSDALGDPEDEEGVTRA